MILLINSNNSKPIIICKEIFILNDFCKIKNFQKEPEIVLLLNDLSLEKEEDRYLIEETIISLKIKYIFSNNKNNYIEDISFFYNIPLIYLNFL